MTGEQLYDIDCSVARALGLVTMPAWGELSRTEQVDWDERAHEQELRDRDLPANLRELKP